VSGATVDSSSVTPAADSALTVMADDGEHARRERRLTLNRRTASPA
jgi:hypothetical protein